MGFDLDDLIVWCTRMSTRVTSNVFRALMKLIKKERLRDLQNDNILWIGRMGILPDLDHVLH